MARPKKKPGSGKVKVTLTLNPKIYKAAQKLCFDEEVSVSEKIDRLFEPLVKSHIEKAKKQMEKAKKAMDGGGE